MKLRTISVAGLVLAIAAMAAPAAAQTTPVRSSDRAQTGPTLPLTMDQAVALALESNLGLQSARLNLVQASHAIEGARAQFLPIVSSSFGRQTAKFVPSDFTQGQADLSSSGLSVSGSVSQSLRWFGGSYSLAWAGSRTAQIGGLSSFNPRLGSSLRLDFSQPLLRGLRTDAGRVNLANTQRRRAISDVILEQRVVATEASVRLAYLSLVAAIEGLKVAELNMDIVQQSLRQSRARVAVGQSPQIEIIQAEAQVASNQEQVIVAEAAISTAEDVLRSLILDPARPDYWTVRLVPTDEIELAPREVNLDDAIRTALANRLDLNALKREMEITDVNLALTKDNLLPNVNFNLSYSAAGTAGTQFVFGSGFPPPVIDSTTRSFAAAVGDAFGAAYPSWGLGVSVSYPIGRSAQQVAHAQTQVSKRQQELSLRELELEIVRQVRDAVRQVDNSFQRVQAAQAFRQAAEQQLEAEERRFAVGLSTTLERQVRQSDLARARTAELNAMISYARALIVLDRVQRTQ